ncbi:transglutaminase-like cysteine peptidase [Affinirhizobium pseudoryzae]|uniref:transglutaminase-like cysteine peptidase n=1 Tax=Allorhizobium pseudoryzae TaxID=379684 RepID=UPI001F47FA34|nr:transglutaminase-like cysteine peptidase [Allorhizobium pseudoryzae]
MIKKLLTASAAFAMLVSSVTPSSAFGPAGLASPLKDHLDHIQVAQPVLAPFGFVSYCVQNQEDCKPSAGPETVEWSYRMMRELRQVNYRINKSIVPVNDDDGSDQWQASAASGDCEDYVLTKRKELINKGWPAKAMRIAVAYTPDNIGHAVLVVRTTKGDLVLDNRTNSIVSWRETDLRWVMLQSGENPLFWNSVAA